MDIKYPVYLNRVPAGSRPLGESMPRSLLTFGDKENVISRFAAFIAASDLEFLQQLVADANNAATVQADYDRLEAKIDAMVEARVTSQTKADKALIKDLKNDRELLRMQLRDAESSAFVDAKARQALRDSNNELTKYSAQLRKDNEALAGRVNGLREERESIVAANNSHYKELEALRQKFFDEHMENGKLRAVIKLFKHTVGEQRQHLRRLRAKLVKRALKAGEERAVAARTGAWYDEAFANVKTAHATNHELKDENACLTAQLKDIRRYMHEQGWKLPAEPRPADATFLNLVKAAKSRGYKNPKDWALRRMGQVDHKDGDLKNNTPCNLAVEVRNRYKNERAEEKATLLGPVPFSDKMFEEAAKQPIHTTVVKSRTTPSRYPFPKKGE